MGSTAAASARGSSDGGDPLVVDPHRHLVGVEPNEFADLQEGDAAFSDEAPYEDDLDAQQGRQGLTVDQSHECSIHPEERKIALVMNGDFQMPILDTPQLRDAPLNAAVRLDGSVCCPPTTRPPVAGHFGLGSVLIAMCLSGSCQLALGRRDRRILGNPTGRRPVPAPAGAYARSGRLPW
jgi:hypothetical protein